MLRRYCPPTLNSASVICPRLATLTVSINSSNTFPPSLATFWSWASAAVVASPSIVCLSVTRVKQFSFSSGVARANSISKSSALFRCSCSNLYQHSSSSLRILKNQIRVIKDSLHDVSIQYLFESFDCLVLPECHFGK